MRFVHGSRPIVFFRVVAMAAFVVSTACAPAHVQLVEPPPKGAPLDVRLEFYDEHRPSVVSTYPAPSLLLENGQRIHHPSDLVASVDEGAPTAVAAGRALDAEATSERWVIAGWTTAGVGAALALGGVITAIVLRRPDAQPGELDPGPVDALGVALGGAAVLLAGGLITLGAMPTVLTTYRESQTAFLTYDRSLRRRLALTNADLMRRRAPAGSTVSHAPPLANDDALPTARLTVMPLPSMCGDLRAIRTGAVQRLGRDPFVDDAKDEIRIAGRVERDDVIVTVELARSGALVGPREFRARAVACPELLARAALAISVLLDPLSPTPSSE